MRLTYCATVLFLTTMLGGCSGRFPLEIDRLFPVHAPSQHPEKSSLRQIDSFLATNKPRAALTLINRKISQGEPEAHFGKHYPQAMNGVLNKALQLQQQGQALEAGLLYRTAHSNYPRSLTLREHTSMTLIEIDASIELCANALLDEGLQAYRRGELEAAIHSWEAITRFHPEHIASQRAITTTRTQLANLKKLQQQ
ncbi:MAG: hypothetical protein C0624_03700 [Desulfuromonas sp.]|nr:MAG: hypothetical protein C0624_03700 [Desulfuromonas sp.]